MIEAERTEDGVYAITDVPIAPFVPRHHREQAERELRKRGLITTQADADRFWRSLIVDPSLDPSKFTLFGEPFA